MDIESKEHRSLVDTLRKNGVSECRASVVDFLFFFFLFVLSSQSLGGEKLLLPSFCLSLSNRPF
jgi:hypothetical protein